MTKIEWDKLHSQDKKEIINLIEIKKNLKKVLTNSQAPDIIKVQRKRTKG